MRDCLFRKGLVLAIIILFIGMSVFPSTAINTVEKTLMPTSRGKTLYVGCLGPGCYDSIQDAIEDARNGDTVFVFDDSSPYNEFVWVNKSINLIGEDRNTTVIDGWGTGYRVVVYITVDNVSVTGFTIYNCSENMERGIWIRTTSNVIIKGNIITNNWEGILDWNSNNSTILDNTITNTTIGIDSAFASTTIKGNTILNHTIGIHLQGTSHIIEGNFISTSKTGTVYNTWGIKQRLSAETNIIQGNTITKHLVGIGCYSSSNQIICGNTITNSYVGIDLWDSSNIEINENRITNNSMYGINFLNSSKNNIVRNTIANSSIYGIYLKYSSSYNRIKENNFMENDCNAFFKSSSFNQWISNYWNRPRLLPYPIFGTLKLWKFTIPWFNIDWRPAKEPYDIGV